jgi:predicted phosphohydrolase
MAVFAIADLHLSFSADKSMHIFDGWNDYVRRIEKNWRQTVGGADTVVLAGDTSWGMTLDEAKADFEFLHSLPGQKVIIKGNHDYWWAGLGKMENFFLENRLDSLSILHNNCKAAGGIVICGTRGWVLEGDMPNDAKLAAREEGRLKASLNSATELPGEKVVFLHYPPVYRDSVAGGMLDLMIGSGVSRCYYGHLHAEARASAFEGRWLGIEFKLISADHLNFRPALVEC